MGQQQPLDWRDRVGCAPGEQKPSAPAWVLHACPCTWNVRFVPIETPRSCLLGAPQLGEGGKEKGHFTAHGRLQLLEGRAVPQSRMGNGDYLSASWLLWVCLSLGRGGSFSCLFLSAP